MTQENKDALYREEFEKYYFEDYKVSYNESDKLHFETYLAGRRKGQEEIDKLNKSLDNIYDRYNVTKKFKKELDEKLTWSEKEIIELKKEIESSSRLAQIQSSKLHWAIGLFTDEQHEWFKGMLKTQGLSLDPPIDHVGRLNKEIKSLKKEIEELRGKLDASKKLARETVKSRTL